MQPPFRVMLAPLGAPSFVVVGRTPVPVGYGERCGSGAEPSSTRPAS